MTKISLVRSPERSLATLFPEVAAEWHWTKNGDLTPILVTSRNGRKAWWRCEKDHDWQARIGHRTGPTKSGCPVCSGRQVLSGVNDLETKFPDIAAEWHWSKNGSLTPDHMAAGTPTKVWWRCTKDHDWKASIQHRTGASRTGCPVCSGRQVLSGVNDLETKFPDIAAEWHRTKNDDLTPDQVGAGSHTKAWWRCEKDHDWQANITNRTSPQKSGCPVCRGKRIQSGVNDLETKFPEIAAEWHRSKNGNLTPDKVLSGTEAKAWWRCEKDHDWQASIGGRTGSHKPGCPVCAGKQVRFGSNDLETRFPEIAAQWHRTKNGILTPSHVVAGAASKAWWRCEKDHDWQAKIANRTNANKRGCPYCSARRILSGFNDLETKFPDIAAEWHRTKNGDLTPDQVIAGTPARAWWRCEKDHDWKASTGSRTGPQKSGCPVCGGKQVLFGFNDLETKFPEIAAQWHRTKNGILTPSQMAPGTPTKVWWRCEKNHDWKASIGHRTGPHKSGCPVCNSRAWSKVEVYLGAEIALFTRIQRYRPTPIVGRRWVDDIYLPEFDIVIEFDGERWHKDDDMIKSDTEKVGALAAAGCRIIRCRTGELPFLGPYDVRGSNTDFKLNANNVLLGLADLGVLDKKEAAAYVAKPGLQNKAEAEAEIARLEAQGIPVPETETSEPNSSEIAPPDAA